MRYKKTCNCGNCTNSMYLDYFGKLLLPTNEGDLKKSEKRNLNTVYFSFKTKFTQRNPEGFIDASIQMHPEELPAYIENLQKIYSEYQEVKQELQKQGKLEKLSNDSKSNPNEQKGSTCFVDI